VGTAHQKKALHATSQVAGTMINAKESDPCYASLQFFRQAEGGEVPLKGSKQFFPARHSILSWKLRPARIGFVAPGLPWVRPAR